MKSFAVFAALVLAAVAPSGALFAQMPDVSQMSGVPLPVSDVPNGTVVVRVIRGSLANNVSDHPVELIAGGRSQTVRTDASGRAQFSGLASGAAVSASTTLDGRTLRSQEFPVPSSGGVRLLLVGEAPDAGAGTADPTQPAAAPAEPGSVVLGEQSRFVFEYGDGSISVFNILQIVNSGPSAVGAGRTLVFDLPRGATGASILQDSSPQATVNGSRVSVVGPFASGPTLVQFAYSMPYSGPTVEISQPLPAPLGRVIVLAQKIGEMKLASPQLAEQREMNAEGQTYIVGQGPGLKAGDVISFTFSGLPHAPTWPRNVALALAVVILIAGAWASRRAFTQPAAERSRARLESRRGKLFEELTGLERLHKEGRIDPQRYAARRQELVSALERIYAEIDRQAA